MVEVYWSCVAVAARIITGEGVLRPLLRRRRLGQHTSNELLFLLQEESGLVVLEIDALFFITINICKYTE